MKTLLLISALFFGQFASGQYQIDPNIKHEFDSLFRKQPKDIKKKRYIKGVNDGFALLVEIREDTLNSKEFTPYEADVSITIVAIDKDGNELPATPEVTTKYNQWLFCQASFQNDTLIIGSYFGMFSGVGFVVKITGDQTIGDYFEYVRRDSIYRKNNTGIKSSEIQVNARTENVILSRLPKKTGDIFYGKVILVTEPFYRDNDAFKNGYIHKRYTITYLFTCKLTDAKKNRE